MENKTGSSAEASAKAGKYFKYAIGEIILVVIGILIALQINNWNEERFLRQEERAILEELNANLEVNVTILNDYISEHRAKKNELKKIIEHIENKRPYTDSLGIYLRNARKGEYLSLVTSAFESLKSVGFNLIKSRTLRTNIINLFNYDYDQSLKTISSIVEMQYQSTHEVYVKHLSYDDSDIEKVIPNDYEILLEDKEFYNLLTYRVAGKNGAINNSTQLLESTKNLQKLLDEVLNIND